MMTKVIDLQCYNKTFSFNCLRHGNSFLGFISVICLLQVKYSAMNFQSSIMHVRKQNITGYLQVFKIVKCPHNYSYLNIRVCNMHTSTSFFFRVNNLTLTPTAIIYLNGYWSS